MKQSKVDPQNFSKMPPVLHHRHNAGLEISQERHLPCITKILGFGFMAYIHVYGKMLRSSKFSFALQPKALVNMNG